MVEGPDTELEGRTRPFRPRLPAVVAAAVIAIAGLALFPDSLSNQDTLPNQDSLFDLPPPTSIAESLPEADPVVVYLRQATRICKVASIGFVTAIRELLVWDDPTLEEQVAWHKAAAQFSEGALAELRALSLPSEPSTWINRMLSLVEQETAVLRQLAAAASAGDWALVEKLTGERLTLTHHRIHQGCPIELPA